MEFLEASVVFLQDIKKDQQTTLYFMEVPTLDFLLKKHVIPMNDEWAADDEPSNDNLLLKTILFRNKMRITGAAEKLILHQDMGERENLEDLQNISIKLLDKITGVEYVGVGFNFLSTMKCENPGEEIKKRFLTPIPKLPIAKIISGAISYVYKIGEIQVTININAVKRSNGPEEGIQAISFSANYHLGVPYVKKMQDFIKEMPSLKSDYLEQSRTLFG